MANSRLSRKHPAAFSAFAVGFIFLSTLPSLAVAQQPITGFAVERFYPSAPGGGWFVMDDINISGGLGGAISLTTGYSHNPLIVTSPDSKRRLALVSSEAFLDVGMSATYNRYRVYVNLPMPLLVSGNSGMLGPLQLTAPSVNLGTNPDTISDSRVGFDVRLLGKPGDAFRLGGSAQLIIPSGFRSDYVTDNRYRGMLRILAAGEVGAFSYAGQFGVHLRPVEGSLPPGGPNGNELLFGVSAGRRLWARKRWVVVAGPEIFGETAVHKSVGDQTGLEGLLTGRLEGTGDGKHLRFKLGIGHGLVQQFGAPQWRILISVEVFGHRSNS